MIGDRLRLSPKAARNASSAALMMIGTLALYHWVLAPHVGYLRAMQRLGPVVDQVSQERDRMCSTREAKQKELQALRREAARIEGGLFTPSQTRTFVDGLLPLIEETGCIIDSVEVSAGGPSERIAEPNVPFTLTACRLKIEVSGPSGPVVTWLERLQNHRPQVWIDSCQMDFSGGQAGVVRCRLVLTVYTMEEKKEPVHR